MNPDPADDMRLRRAFELRTAYYAALVSFAVRLGCSKSDAQQVVNDSLIDLAMRDSSLRAKSIENERAWLYGVVRNKVRGLLRHHRRSVLVRDFHPGSLLDASVTPEKWVELREILDAIRNLPYRHRLPLALMASELPYSEIAAILGCTVDNAKQRVCRARKALRRKLGAASSASRSTATPGRAE